MNLDVEATLNVTELESVRSKLLQLQETMNYFLHVVDPAIPYVVPWPELLDKFNILVAKFIALHEAAVAPALQRLHVHPGEPPATAEQAHNLRILLRTKLIPELESSEKSLLGEIRKEKVERGGESGSSRLGASEAPQEIEPVEIALQRANWMIQQHDSFCSMAEEALDRHREAAEKVEGEEAMDRHREAAEKAEGEEVVDERADEAGPMHVLPGFVAPPVARSPEDDRLLDSLTFIHSGPKGTEFRRRMMAAVRTT